MYTRQRLLNATRAQLIKYLESRGYQCSAKETTAELRKAALLHYTTENA